MEVDLDDSSSEMEEQNWRPKNVSEKKSYRHEMFEYLKKSVCKSIVFSMYIQCIFNAYSM